jgi:hypothetical protein
MLTVVQDRESSNENVGGVGRSLLDEIVRDGARQMLTAALQAEVAAISSSSPIRTTRRATVWWSATAITSNGRCSPRRGLWR